NGTANEPQGASPRARPAETLCSAAGVHGAESTGLPGHARTLARGGSNWTLTSRQRFADSVDQSVIAIAAAGQQMRGGRQITIAELGGQRVIVLEDRRAVLVIVRVIPLEEHQPPR